MLTLEEVAEFSRQEQAAVEAMGLRSGEFLLLVDTSEAVIQTQEVVAALTDLVAHSKHKAARIAVARYNSLSRMQTRRILAVRDNAMVFDQIADAEAWLFADGLPPVRRAQPAAFARPRES
ncbi:hypothetical protein [Stakelama tenebrarum]|uniref:STAS/SEC14 domain-containing protein n=1 Tax=Stakelama tenebrarum TaxID=2711215 RepID=A0A6G6Y5Z1_9SPHN|nr:hypothetical protein [Sphingosinithalassobacter tenebrarum]QIG80138.1 hypothetical protein G5C33_10335 [Sphingosinithalassobacter tenebrarum]